MLAILGLCLLVSVESHTPSRNKHAPTLNDQFPECRSQIFNPLSSTEAHQCANIFAGMAALTGLDVTIAQPELDSLRHMEVFIEYCNKLYIKHKYRIMMMGWHSPPASKYTEQAQKRRPNMVTPGAEIDPAESIMLLKCHDLQSKIETMRVFVEGPKEETEENSSNQYAKQLDKCQGLFFTLKAGQYPELVKSFEANNRSKEDLGTAIVKCHSLVAILNGGNPALLKESDPVCEHCKKCRDILDKLSDGKLQEVENEYQETLHLGLKEIGQAIAQCHKMGIKAMIESLQGIPHGPHRSQPLLQHDAPMAQPTISDPEEKCVSPNQLLSFFLPVIQLVQMQPSRMYNDMPLLKEKAEEILQKRRTTVKEKVPKETGHICELFLALKSAIPELEYKCCGVHTVCDQYVNYIKREEIEKDLVKSQTSEVEQLPDIPRHSDNEVEQLPDIPQSDESQEE